MKIDLNKYKGHTEGPWGVEKSFNTLWVGPMHHRGVKVRDIVVSLDYDPESVQGFRDQQLANAHLFADSPLILQRCMELEEVKEAAKSLIEDVRERYPNEDLRCPHMIRLDQALSRAEEGE